MGTRNPDRVPLAYRRRKCESVREMLEQRWDVISRCRKCELLMTVDLRMIARVRGPDFSLWNRKSHCRRVGCGGVVEFQAKAPGMAWHEPLEAPWPDGVPPRELPSPQWLQRRSPEERPMADDKTKRDYRDRDRINIHEAYEVEYWSKRFGVTPQQLRDAVGRAGVMVKDVARDLGKSS